MPHITKQEIKELREFLNVSDLDDTHWTHRMLDRIEKQPEAEPVAWHTDDHLTDRTATTYRKEMMQAWQYKGWPITPLYTKI